MPLHLVGCVQVEQIDLHVPGRQRLDLDAHRRGRARLKQALGRRVLALFGRSNRQRELFAAADDLQHLAFAGLQQLCAPLLDRLERLLTPPLSKGRDGIREGLARDVAFHEELWRIAGNRFVLSFQYELPRLDGSSLATRLILGGWQFNSIFQVQSGNPFSVNNSSTTAQSLTFRPNQTCNPSSGAQHQAGTLPTQHYINTSCFSLPSVTINGVSLIDNSQSGNAHRNSAVGPGYNTLDASFFKIVNFGESRRFEYRFETFNLFNEAHFSQPVATFGSSTFGQITSTVGNDSRVIQMAIKLAF